MKYESFSIRIELSPGSLYAVSVQSPQGEGQAAEIRELIARPSVPAAPALDVGKDLYRTLFKDEVANLFHSSLGGLRGRNRGLRINISINPRSPELAHFQKLPWELLCRPETEDFLCLSRRTPVVRSLEAHRERRPAIARPRRLRILAVAANPVDCPSLDLARERASLEEAWEGQSRNVEIVFLQRGGVEEMRQALLAAPFHILHFMGHGKFDEASGEGALIFERYDGTAQSFEGRRLAQLLHDFESLRLVVLNACHTADAVGRNGPNPFAGAASSLVMGGVPAVVAMSGPVSDDAAVAFSRTLYQRLSAGDAIEEAVTEGRLAIQRADPEDGSWATPALFLRNSDGELFAPRSTVWARRAALLTGFAVALALIWLLASGWVREHRSAEVRRLANDGIGLLELGRKEEARNAFRSALHIDPHNAVTLGNLCIVEVQLGDDEAALAHAEAAAKAAPEEAVHQYNLGNLLARKKRYEEALYSLRRAVEIDSDYTHAYNELGNVYLDLDRPADARKAFEAGLKRDRTQARLHKNLARAALAERRPEEAILHLETALSLFSPADPAGKAEATYWLATAQAAAGRGKEACVALQRFEFLDPRLLSPFAKDATLLARQHGCPYGL
jgi:tetratricopeptide (TPR) repeat protein